MRKNTDYYGKLSIPNSKRKELEERSLELMRRGGLMTFAHVSMFGHSIKLLCPPVRGEDGNVRVSYSYFEESFENDCLFDSKSMRFYSEDCLWKEFEAVVDALDILPEFYSDSFAIACPDRCVSDQQRAIGWLNHLFDEEYTNKRVEDLNKIHSCILKTEGKNKPQGNLVYLTRISIGGRSKEMVDNALQYLLDCDFELKRSRERVSPTETAIDYMLALRTIKESTEIDDLEKVQILKDEFINLDVKTLRPRSDLVTSDVTAGIYTLPRDFAISAFAKIFGLDRAKLTKELVNAPKDISHIWYNPDGLKAIPKIRTSVYLGNICDDDLAYFWRNGSDDVVFSQDMENWISELKTEFDIICETLAPYTATELMKELIVALEHGDREFLHIYAQRDMFFEFIDRMNERSVQAAVILLEHVIDRNLPAPPRGSSYEWTFGSSVLRRSSARLQVKRYLAIMANRELRQLRFGF